MLTQEENELLCHIEGDVPMGQMLRHYWFPICLSEELAEPDGVPVPVKLLGEDLVVFRNSKGKIGLLDAYCPHRTAPLVLGRNEECGLRCLYHGWKFDVHGNCVDMPSEPEEYSFKDRIKVKSYPTKEAGGMVWAYLGPKEKMPPFPEFSWMKLPTSQRVVGKAIEEANFVQSTEGVIDSAHSWFLHRGYVGDFETRLRISEDFSPRLEAEDTPYGFRYAAIRKTNQDPDKNKYVRVTLLVMPSTGMVPLPIDRTNLALVQIFVPMDNYRTMQYSIFFSNFGEELDKEKVLKAKGMAPGIDVDKNWEKIRTLKNRYLQDRNEMKSISYSGISGFANQDMAMQEGMGSIADRTREHLGTSDIAIIHYRRLLLKSVRAFMNGEKPHGLKEPVNYELLKAEQKVIPIDQPWQTLGAGGLSNEYQTN